jgi:hypothetical protein
MRGFIANHPLTIKWKRSIHEVAVARRSLGALEDHIDGRNAREVLELQRRVDAAENQLRELELHLAKARRRRRSITSGINNPISGAVDSNVRNTPHQTDARVIASLARH